MWTTHLTGGGVIIGCRCESCRFNWKLRLELNSDWFVTDADGKSYSHLLLITVRQVKLSTTSDLNGKGLNAMCKVSITLVGQVKGLNPITRPLSVQLIIAVDVQPAVHAPAQQQHNSKSRKCNTQLSWTWCNYCTTMFCTTIYGSTSQMYKTKLAANIQEHSSEDIKVQISTYNLIHGRTRV